MEQNFFDIAQLENSRKESGRAYLEFLRVSSLSAGVYVLAAGSTDTQKPHREDEMYYVVRGRARMRIGGEAQAVTAGSVIFVAAQFFRNHRGVSCPGFLCAGGELGQRSV
jgi:mannose-6-phosphate isomerase-like protein (cupin superfamily)